MGFPYGSDEDAAFIIAWLELNKFKGISLLASLINELDKKYEGRIKLDNLCENINFKNKSILMKGEGLIDFMCSELENNKKISVKITNCKDGVLFLPILYKKSEFINLSLLTFHNNKTINTYKINNNQIIFNQKKNNNLFDENIVLIEMHNNNENLNNLTSSKIISKKEIQQNLAQSLKPEAISWDKVSKIANKTYVPESDESRSKGAGGGDDND